MFEIEKGIPLPKQKHIGPKPKYPLKEMGVGDSFFVPGDNSRYNLSNNVSAAARHNAPDKKFKTRTVEGGIRVWRVS